MMAGMAMKAGSAYAQSKNAKAMYNAQAAVSENNALLASWEAEDALKRGDKAAAGVRLQGRLMKGNQRAAMGANNVDLGVGSALQILTDTDYFSELDALETKDNAAREAWALRNQAINFKNQAAMSRAQGKAQKPLLAMATSLLGSGASAGDGGGSLMKMFGG